MKKKIKLLLSIFLFFSLYAALNAQEENQAESNTITSETTSESIEKKRDSKASFLLQVAPGAYINPDYNELNSAPSAPVYPISLGVKFPKNKPITFEPTISFFHMYNLWYDGTAYPAEIENRTTSTLCFLLNFPVVFNVKIFNTTIQLYPGAAIFSRIGLMAAGVSNDDSGFSGTAAGDKKLINNWFWTNMRFLYLSAGASWMFYSSDKVKTGPVINIYMPTGTIFSGESIQGMIATAGLKIIF